MEVLVNFVTYLLYGTLRLPECHVLKCRPELKKGMMTTVQPGACQLCDHAVFVRISHVAFFSFFKEPDHHRK